MAGRISNPTMLVDLSLCVGCEACTVVCKQRYNLARGMFRTRIQEVETGSFTDSTLVHTKKACMHCTEAACVLVCPTKACHKRDDGLVAIDSKKCIGCNYCVANCSFGVTRFDQARATAEKCTMCADLIDNGQEPLCAQVCTASAISFGPREEMVAAGEARVSKLRGEGFSDAYLYGVRELEGLKVLMVLREAPEACGLPADPQVPVGAYAWRYVSSPAGGIVAAAGIAALAFNFLHSRKNSPDVNK